MDLFTHAHEQRMKSEAPLAARLRPLDEFVGQEDILGPGKTTLAMVIANQTKSHFETLSAVLAGKAELKEVIEAALERRKLYQKKTVLFVKNVREALN